MYDSRIPNQALEEANPMTHVPHLTKIFFALAFGAVLLAATNASSYAQEADQAPQEGEHATMQGMEGCPMMKGMNMQGMTGGGMEQMHEQMMERPRMRSAMQVHLLPVLKDSLSLTDDQVVHLKQAKSQYLKEQKSLKERQSRIQEQLQKVLKAEEPSLDKVQSLLSEQKKLETEEEMTLYRTAAQMKEELSEKQRARFADLGPQEMHHAAMAHLSMQDMMRMMQGMHEECPMMENMEMGGMGMMEGTQSSMQGMEDCPMMGEGMMEQEEKQESFRD